MKTAPFPPSSKLAWLLVVGVAATRPAFAFPAASPAGALPGGSVSATYLQLPLAFEANQGQCDGRVKFLARGQGYSLFLTPDEAVLSLRSASRHDSPAAGRPATGAATKGRSSGLEDEVRRAAVVRMRFAGANRQAKITGLDPLPGRSNYILGNDPAKWRRDVPNYAKVKYAQVYSGIDVVFYGNQRRLEYDLILSTGADPRRIELAFDGVEGLSVDRDGNLVLATADGEIVQQKPVVYQETDGGRREVEGRYVLQGKLRARFQVAAYDRQRPLVIDPVLSYSTYLGSDGSNDSATGIALDGIGNIYLTGGADGDGFPILGGVQPTRNGQSDVFVTKISAAGALVYSTYIGGVAGDYGLDIAVDGSGSAYVAGYAMSNDFPTTAGAFQTAAAGWGDAIVLKLNPAGNALVYSTYLGGGGTSGLDQAFGIAVDAGGNAYVVGNTRSTAFPTTAGAYQTTYGGGTSDMFVTKLNPTGTGLVYSTFVGGSDYELSGNNIRVDGGGNAYVTGATLSTNFPTTPGAYQTASGGGVDAYVTKLNATGSALVYSTYLGGSGADNGNGIALDTTGAAYVVGSTASGNFPIVGPYQAALSGTRDVFVTKLNAAGSALTYSTYLGGSSSDYGYAIAADGSGNTYITGYTGSGNFPTVNPLPAALSSYDHAFVTELNSAGSALLFSTYLGADGYDTGNAIAVDGSGGIYVAGRTSSNGFPTVNPIQATKKGTISPFDYDGFVAKLGPSAAATTTAVVSSLNPSTFGQTVTFTATVTGTSPTGTIQFKDGATNLGAAVTMSGGQATYPTSALTVGSHNITAVYSGDASNAASTSPVLTQVVNKVPTTTAVSSTLNPSTVGQSVTFTATVTGTSPTGTIQFMDGATALGAAVTMSGGQASYPTSALTVGSHNITAVYSGDTNNAASTSPVLTQVVLALSTPAAIPTLSGWGLLALALGLAGIGARWLGGRSAV